MPRNHFLCSVKSKAPCVIGASIACHKENAHPIFQRLRDDNKNQFAVSERGWAWRQKGQLSKKAVFLGKHHDNTVSKEPILLSDIFAQASRDIAASRAASLCQPRGGSTSPGACCAAGALPAARGVPDNTSGPLIRPAGTPICVGSPKPTSQALHMRRVGSCGVIRANRFA